MGIAFDAKGPLHGALPDRPAMQLAGSITMKGTAYYAYSTALLLSLDATLAIDGNIDDAAQRSPVSIVYSRSIRSADGRRPPASSRPPAAPESSARRSLRGLARPASEGTTA